MFFRKEKRMIDVRELQKRGVVRIPKQDLVIPTDQEGFIEFGNKPKPAKTQTSSNTEFFGFGDSTSTTPSEFSTQTDGYNKREVDEKISNLDNKVYKLENRIELLEKKLNIEQPSDNPVGIMGW